MKMTAEFSADRKYRYRLDRVWDETCPNRFIVFGLNPSTADEKVDDPTIRRCVSFAQSAAEQFNRRFGGLIMLNLFAIRAKEPEDMLRAREPVGRDNDHWIHVTTKSTGNHLLVAAWGCNGDYRNADRMIRHRLQHLYRFKLYHFGLTKHGHPKHPLYLPSKTKLTEWQYDHR